jgi:autotransporter-associated beta strand protein
MIWASAVLAGDLRIVCYNINADTNGSGGTGTVQNNQSLTTVLQAIGNEHINGNVQPIDVLALEELSWVSSGASPTLQVVVNDLNGIYGAGTYAYDPTFDYTDGNLTGNGPSGLIYNTKTVTDLGAVSIDPGSVSGSGPPRAPMQFHLQPIGGSSSSAFYLYVSHAKSVTGGTSESRRQQEAAEIVASAGTLGANANYIFSGDFNFNSSSDSDYTTYVGTGSGPAYDPVSPNRNWSDSTLGILTESASNMSFRDDAQLVSGSVLNGTNGLQLVSKSGTLSYTPFGNNGSVGINGSVINSSTADLSDLPNRSAVLSALTTATDHLPVVADYAFASNATPATISLGSVANATIITGGTATVSATVANSAGAGSSNLNYTLSTAISGGSAALGTFAPGSSGSLAPSASQAFTIPATSTSLGVNLISLTAADPNSSNLSQTATATLTVLGHAAPSLSVVSGNSQRVILGATGITAGLNLSNGTSAQSGLASLDVNALGSGMTGGTGAALVASGSAQPYSATLSAGTTGTQVQTFSLNVGDDHTLAGAAPPGNVSAGVTLTVVDNRVVTASATNFGLVHVGASESQSITLSTSGDDSHFTRVTVGNAGPDANGISVTGGANPVFNDSSVTDQRSLGGTFNSLGAISGSVALTTSGEGLAGEAPINVPVIYTAQVYSGKAQWSTSAGAWGSNGNWIDTVGGGPSGAPGLLGFVTDTATFGPGTANGAVAVNLNSAAPLLSGLVFSSTSASFAILQGSGTTGLTLAGTGSSPAAVTVLSGTHSLDVPILLTSNLDVTSDGILTLAGNIGDGGLVKGLTLDGSGVLVLSGTNSYGGGTAVDSGTLDVTNPDALPDGSGLTVGVNAASLFGTAISGSNLPLAVSSGAVASVPEPGTLATLAVAAIFCLVMRSRRPCSVERNLFRCLDIFGKRNKFRST